MHLIQPRAILPALLCAIILSVFTFQPTTYAQNISGCDQDYDKCIADGKESSSCATAKLECKINEYQKVIDDKRGQQKTLASAINLITNQMNLTIAQIAKTEEQIKTLEQEIDELSKKILVLDKDLDATVEIMNVRVEETYKRMHMPSVYLLMVSNKFAGFFSQLNYIRNAQTHDKEILYSLEKARINYDNQKQLKEKKQEETEKLRGYLEGQKKILNQQKAAKQQLLEVTRNDEKRFQELLKTTIDEYNAIQKVLANKGYEEKIADIKEGDKIATIISGASTCSTGTHLHFSVQNGNSYANPASYLSGKDVAWDLCGWYGCDDTFSFSGSWSWPVEGKPIITQGYGMTAYARSGAYGGAPHSGIDIVPDNLTVKAVKEGTLYRGSVDCGNGKLRYVRVKHKDGGAESIYMHVNY